MPCVVMRYLAEMCNLTDKFVVKTYIQPSSRTYANANAYNVLGYEPEGVFLPQGDFLHYFFLKP